jgi:protein O-mannosyl-transferase
MKNKPVRKSPIRKQASPPAKTTKAKSTEKNNYLVYGTILVLFILSIIAFLPITKNDFISTWDDGVYVINNQLLRDISWNGMINIFSYGDDFQKLINNYHPLTTLSLALNYQVSGDSPASYHITNMIFHGFNAVLAFLFIFLLTRRRLWPAVITGLLFAVHPMHVESVAWVAERKDVLYVFFFLSGLIAYLEYLKDEKTWKLGITFLLFLFSCLSKAMAVPFPMILLLVDYFLRRKFSWKMVIEKIPFFLIALVIGWMSVQLQSTSAIGKLETFTLFQRTMHASYGFLAYIIKFFNPTGLSAFYPYPAITTTGLLPATFRFAPYVFLIVAGISVWLSTRKGDIPRAVLFGILFYFLTIALVLQFLSVGKAIMADRYTYLPYLGLSFIIGMLADFYIHSKSPLNYIGYGLAAATIIMVIIFSFMTHERTKVWKDDITLWSDVLQQYPDGRMDFIYEKRAREFLLKDQYKEAMADYQAIKSHDPRNDNALECIGRIYGKYYHDLEKSVENLEQAYAVNPKNPAVLKSLGVAMGMKGNFPKSLDYLLQAYELDKADTNLVRNISASYNYMGLPVKAREFEQQARSGR